MLRMSKYLLPEERVRLEMTLESSKEKDFRNTSMLWLLLYTGARGCEVLKIKKNDLFSNGNVVFITGSKGGSSREIPVPAWLFNRLRVLCNDLGDDDCIFPIGTPRLRSIWREYRPVKKGSHCMRHAFAMGLYDKTKDARLVKNALGHRWLSTTEIYLRYQNSSEDLRKALGYEI